MDIYKRAYLEYWNAVEAKTIRPACKMIPYSYESDIEGVYWSTMERDFTRQLLNTVNGFADQINNLNIWKNILLKYNEDEQYQLRFEFTQLPLYFCLHKPNEYKDRLIYCSTHLCHQANLSTVKPYKDNLEKDHHIKMKTLLKVSKTWERAHLLIKKIKLIAANDFKEATNQYRNKSQHRIPPSLENGHTNFITRRQIDKKRANYIFGYDNPITTESALPTLIQQWSLMGNAFQSYWDLIEEQNAVLLSHAR